MRKRILSILLCLCMALGLLPVSALAADYNSWAGATAGGVTLTADTDKVTIDGTVYTYKGDASTSGIEMYTAGGDKKALTEACCWKAGGGYVLYKPTVENGKTTSAEVTLHGAEISTVSAFALSLPYNSSYPVPVTVKVESANSLTTTDKNYYALYHEAGDTTFTGGGTLTITGRIQHINAVTIESGTHVTVSGNGNSHIVGNLTVTGSGSKLTIASGTGLYMGIVGYNIDPDNAPTVTVENGAVLENNGTLDMQLRTKDTPGITGEISGGGGILFSSTKSTTQYTLVDGVFYPYGGDVSTSGLNISGKDNDGTTNTTYNAPATTTRYKAGDGYISYTPAVTGDTPANAKLELHNATINTTSGRALFLPAAPVDITVTGDNALTANGSYNYAIDPNGQAVNITGDGNLTLTGSKGIASWFSSTPSVTVDIGGNLGISTTVQSYSIAANNINLSTASITAGIITAGGGSFTATAKTGNLTIGDSTSNTQAVYAGNITLEAPNGAISVVGQGILLEASGMVTANAKGDITLTGTNTSSDAIRFGTGVSITSTAGSIDVTTSGYSCIEKSSYGTGGSKLTLNAAKDITLNAAYNAIPASGQAVDITAGGKLSSTSAYGFQVGALNIKANEVSVAGTQQDGIEATSVSITNPTGGNCKSVSVTATSSSDTRAAIAATGNATTGNITVKADDLFICGKDSAKAISAHGTVTIGDAGMIVGTISAGTDNISTGVVRGQSGGDVGTSGLNLATPPTEATVYTAGNGYILWNPTDKTLALHNASINTGNTDGIDVPDGTTIVLHSSTSNIVKSGSNGSYSIGIDCYSGSGPLTIDGAGSLTVTAGTASGENNSLGIYSESNIVIKNGIITTSGGASEKGSAGICSGTGSVAISGGTVKASGGVSTVSVLTTGSTGIMAATDMTISGGDVTATGGTATSARSLGVYAADGTLSITGGTLSAAGNTAAVAAKTDVTIGSSRTVTAPSGSTVGESNGYKTVFSGSAPATTVTVSAKPSSGGLSGGGSSSSTVTVPVSSNEGNTKVSASISGSTATVSMTDTQIKEIVSGTETAGKVKIDVSGLKVDTAVVPATVVSAVGTASGSTGLAVVLPTGTVTLDKNALGSVVGKGDVKISVDTVANTSLSDTQKATLGNQANTALVVDVNVYVNGTKTSTFGNGKIEVSVPYTPKSGENVDSITVWFVKDDGTIEPKNGTYNASTGCVEFTTEHLSQYLIVSFPFADVAEDSWYYGSVAYAYNNGLFSGASATTFSPDTSMTRQMIWMVLARMDGDKPVNMEAARAWAMEKGISDGTNPTDTITREQMATILYRYATFKKCDTTQGSKTISGFTDYNSISEFAQTPLTWAVSDGLMQGSDNNLMPQGYATRAQVAAILQRYCQNVAK